MKFPFDEDKRQATLKKHGFDLRDFAKLFDLPWCHDKKVEVVDGEIRKGVIGYLGKVLVVGIYTERGAAWRAVTMFPANPSKRAYYEKETAGSEGKRAKKRAKKRRTGGNKSNRKRQKGRRRDR